MEWDAQARADMYRFLATVYLVPAEPVLLRKAMDPEFLDDLAVLLGDCAISELRKFAATANLDRDSASLKQEFMSLFAIPTGRYVTPFEDVYLGRSVDGQQERGPLLGWRAVGVRRMYREAGAGLDPACKELPTHVGVELSFMSFLCEREAQAIASEGGGAVATGESRESVVYREIQETFLGEHLNRWFPELREAIERKAAGPLYRGMAQLTAAFLARDAAGLTGQGSSATPETHSVRRHQA